MAGRPYTSGDDWGRATALDLAKVDVDVVGPGVLCNILVAHAVLGLPDVRYLWNEWGYGIGQLVEMTPKHVYGGYPIPRLSEDITAAWQVMEHLLHQGQTVHVQAAGPTTWSCTIQADDPAGVLHASAQANSAPLALCRAARAAVNAPSSGN